MTRIKGKTFTRTQMNEEKADLKAKNGNSKWIAYGEHGLMAETFEWGLFFLCGSW